MLEDRLLIVRFNRGDADALRRIYEKYKHDLLRTAAALLYDRNGTEDVVHDVFVSFAKTVGSFKLYGSLKGYLSICVANRARDKNRTLQRRQNSGPDRTEPIHSDKKLPEDSAICDELSEKLDYAIASLPEEQREIIILHLLSKTGFRQIAGAKGISVNTALSRYRYGLKKLRSILDGELEK
jgi:RNA polymerase sigma-70 factor (ECF subfamily)